MERRETGFGRRFLVVALSVGPKRKQNQYSFFAAKKMSSMGFTTAVSQKDCHGSSIRKRGVQADSKATSWGERRIKRVAGGVAKMKGMIGVAIVP